MLKKFAKMAGGVIAVLVFTAIIACDNEVLPTGDLISQGGRPGGDRLGGSVERSEFPVFDINNLPPPKFWNDQGHYEAFPDLFTFANGRKVQTLEDWTGERGRRWEISKIITNYVYGDEVYYGDGVEVDWEQTNSTTLRIKVTYQERTGTWDMTVHIPDGTPPEGGFPGFINVGGSASATTWQTARQGRYAAIGYPLNTLAPDSQHGGGVGAQVMGLVYDGSNMSVPSAFMVHAWGIGRFIDALETPKNGVLPFDGRIDPKKLMITGMSRYGKAAMVSAIFAKSKKGTQIAVLDIGSAGYLGPAPERFISPLGLHERHSLTVADALPRDNKPGKVYYMQFIGGNEGNSQVPVYSNGTTSGDHDFFADRETTGSVNMPPYGPSYGPLGSDLVTASGGYPLVVKAITPSAFKTARDSADPAVKNSVFIYDMYPYEGISGANYWHGLESLAQLAKGASYWAGLRFPLFADLHYGLRLDDVLGIPLRRPDGFLCSIPWDAHFVVALMAPRAVIIHDGFRTVRNNPEGCFAVHLMVDEVYKFLEEKGVKPAFHDVQGFDQTATLSDFNAFKLYFLPHRYNEYEARDTIDMADVYFGFAAKADRNIARLRDPAFPIDDPRSKNDYSKINWARPGATPISERIKNVPNFDYAGHVLDKWWGESGVKIE